jgi:hypothetical protein
MTSKPEHKETNPKDAIGATKLPLGLIPDSALAETSLAFLEGMLHYGRFNWRAAGVRASIYRDAAERHLAKWYNGEDRDPKTQVHHLASVMACCAIILDADLCGKLTDDRPPSAPVSGLINDLASKVEHLKKVFADCNPHQYTIADKIGTAAVSDESLAVQYKAGEGARTIRNREMVLGHCVDYVDDDKGYIDGTFYTGTAFTSPVNRWKRGFENPDEEIEAFYREQS